LCNRAGLARQPSQYAGLRVGQRIVSINDHRCFSPQDFSAQLVGVQPGERIKVEVAGYRSVDIKTVDRKTLDPSQPEKVARFEGPSDQPPPKTLYISRADVYRELGMQIAASLLTQHAPLTIVHDPKRAGYLLAWSQNNNFGEIRFTVEVFNNITMEIVAAYSATAYEQQAALDRCAEYLADFFHQQPKKDQR
jgi:hypothetical protein